MQVIFANSSIGTDHATPVNDLTRTGLGCATAAELAACRFVRTDGVAFVIDGGRKYALAHVRVNTQAPDLDRLKTFVGDADVYLIGGFALQPGPAAAVVGKFTKFMGMGTAKGVIELHGHIQKPNAFNAGSVDDSGHVTGFVALVGPNGHEIGTHSLFGCVAVLVVPHGTNVVIRKIHIYDATNTLGPIGAYGSAGLTTQVL